MKTLQAMTRSAVIAVQDAATAAVTGNLDTLGADYAVLEVALSAEVNTNSTNVVMSILESDDTVVTNFATFSANHSVTIDNTSACVHAACVPLQGRKRYLRISLTPDTTTNGAVGISVVGILDPEIRPSSSASNPGVSVG